MMVLVLGFIALLGLLTGCLGDLVPGSQPTTAYQQGSLLLEDRFNAPANWQHYDAEGVQVAVQDGGYQMHIDIGAYVWGINREPHTDVVMEASARATSESTLTGYGLICRASPLNNGDGYYFLINNDRTYSIRVGRGQEVRALIAWARSTAILDGAQTNIIRAVCIDDYLALYVNNQFVAETRDHLFSSGVAGFGVVAVQGETMDVSFDNLRIWEGRLGE